MKKITKLFGLILTLAMILNLFASMTAFAAANHADLNKYIRFDLLDDEVVTYVIEITKSDSYTYGLDFDSPKTEAQVASRDWYNTATKTSHGMITITGDNKMHMATGWNFNAAEKGFSPDYTIPKDKPVRLKVCWNNVHKYMDVYVGEKDADTGNYEYYFLHSIGQQPGYTNVANITHIMPFYESEENTGKDFSGFSIRPISQTGTDAGEVEVENVYVDRTAKKVRVEFSDIIGSSSRELVQAATLKNVNTKSPETFTLNGTPVVDGKYATFTYNEEFSNSQKYAIEFPEGIKSKVPRGGSESVPSITYDVLKDTVAYFTTDTWTQKLYSSYDSYDTSNDVNTMGNVLAEDGNKAITLTENGSTVWNVTKQGIGNINKLSFELTPLYNDLYEMIEFGDSDFSELCFAIVFAADNKVIIGPGKDEWWSAGWFNTTNAINNAWSGAKPSATYYAGKKMKFDIIHNKTVGDGTVEFYIDGKLVKTFVFDNANTKITAKVDGLTDNTFSSIKMDTLKSNIFTGIRYREYEDKGRNTDVILFDNAKFATLDAAEVIPFSVQSVEFDSADNSVGSYATLGAAPASIDVYFNGTPQTFTTDNVKVTCDGVEMADSALTITPDATTGVYKITGIPTDAYKIEVEITNVTNGTDTAPAYSTYAYGSTSSIAAVTDENGDIITSADAEATVYTKAKLINDTASPINAFVILAAKDAQGCLIGVQTKTVSNIQPKSALVLSKDTEDKVSLELDGAAASIRSYVWLGGSMKPLVQN